MSKIYLVVSCCGEYEDYRETVEKAFKDIIKAKSYMEELESEEEERRSMAEKCRECEGFKDIACPMYIESAYENGCESWEPWYEPKTFIIREVELVE